MRHGIRNELSDTTSSQQFQLMLYGLAHFTHQLLAKNTSSEDHAGVTGRKVQNLTEEYDIILLVIR